MKTSKQYFITLIITLLCLICTNAFFSAMDHANQEFKQHKKYGKAEVVSTKIEKEDEDCYLRVKLLDLNDNKTYICYGKGIKYDCYPKGSIIDVIYSTGKHSTRVILMNKPPQDNGMLVRVCWLIGNITLGVDIIKMIVQLVKLKRKSIDTDITT